MSANTPVAIVGGGPMGLACAYHLQKRGQDVVVYEAGDHLGGMSVAFDFRGLRIDRHFHFLCRTDFEYFGMLEELGISNALHWRKTKMGMFHDRRLTEWGSPTSLLRFAGLPLSSKLRYAAMVLATRRRSNFDDLDDVNAREWLQTWIGRRGYATLWEPLLAGKFHQHQGNVSAAWIAARIQRLGRSRNRMLEEELGFLEGGSETLVEALGEAIRAGNGRIELNAPVEQISVVDGEVTGLRVRGENVPHQRIISTIPIPILRDMVSFPEEQASMLQTIQHLGVVTVILKLRHSLSPYFWTNISDTSIDIPGIIEFTNLSPIEPHIVYVPFYVPRDHPRYSATHEELLDVILGVFGRINPSFRQDWVIDSESSRCTHAQAICTPGFSRKVPPLGGWIKGLFHADTTSYYPQDRSISESLLTGRQLAAAAAGS